MFSFIRELLLDFPNLALVIQLSIIVIILSAIITITALIIMIFNRYKKYRRDKHEAKIKPKLDHLIYAYISFESDDYDNNNFASKDDILSQVRKHIRRRKDKQLFIDRLIDTKKTVSGKMSLEVVELFTVSGLEKFSLRKLSRFANHKKIMGLSEFVALDAPLADVYIIPLTHSSNRAVRIMARNAYIKLSKGNSFNFFDSNKEELLVWEQIELFKIITTNDSLTIPNFSTWISYSKNKSIIKFCLELVTHYHQTKSVASIMRLLDHNEHDLRSAAIKCLGKMNIVEAETKFVEMYNEQPIASKIEILEAMSNIASGRYIDFLVNEFENGNEFSIRKKAAKALVRNTKYQPEVMTELEDNLNSEQETMLRHYQNPLTQYT